MFVVSDVTTTMTGGFLPSWLVVLVMAIIGSGAPSLRTAGLL
jgi:hypothetical protein